MDTARLNGCAYKLVGLDTVVSGSLERVCLPVVGIGYSSERVHLSGSAYQLVRLDTVLSGCTRTGVLTSWWAWIQF